MLNQFLNQTNKTYNEAAIKDVQRLVSELDLADMKVSDQYEKFNRLAEIYTLLEVHCRYLAEYKGHTDSFFHRELDLLEDFILYLIDLYKFPLSFEKLISSKLANGTEDVETIVIEDIPESDIPDMSFADISTEENKPQKSSFELDLEDF